MAAVRVPLQRQVLGVPVAAHPIPPQQAAQALPDRVMAEVTQTVQVVEGAVPVLLVNKDRQSAQQEMAVMAELVSPPQSPGRPPITRVVAEAVLKHPQLLMVAQAAQAAAVAEVGTTEPLLQLPEQLTLVVAVVAVLVMPVTYRGLEGPVS